MGRSNAVIAGFMTHVCPTFNAQGGFAGGNRPTVVAEPRANRSLPVAGAEPDVCHVYYSALAATAGPYVVVVPSQKEIA
jgi:hypothetical protein